MNWRHSLIYLIILLAAAGYYYWQTHEKNQREVAERAASQLFFFQPEDLRTLEISPQGEKTIRVIKNGVWRITQPIEADTDESVLEHYGETLARLAKEREVEAHRDDRRRFGLDPPALRVRFLAEGSWKELHLGDRNPFGEGFYATTSDTEEVFLIDSGAGESLFRGVEGLRRRQLLSFDPQDVVRLKVQWHEGSSFEVEQRGGEGEALWVDPGPGGKKIRASRVENVLQQIQWLRAGNFLENETVNLEAHGLKPPLVTVVMELKDESQASLQLGRSGKSPEALTALSSQLPGVVEIPPTIYGDLPRGVSDFWDRSVLSREPQEVLEVKWVLRGEEGHVIRRKENQWDEVQEGKRIPLKESWLPGSLLWHMADLEYEAEKDGVEKEGDEARDMSERLWLLGEEGLLTGLSWKPVDRGSTSLQALRLVGDGESLEVLIPVESLETIEARLEAVMRSLRAQ